MKTYHVRLKRGSSLSTSFGRIKRGQVLTMTEGDGRLAYCRAQNALEVTELGQASGLARGPVNIGQRRGAQVEPKPEPEAVWHGQKDPEPESEAIDEPDNDDAPDDEQIAEGEADIEWTPAGLRELTRSGLVEFAELLGLEVRGSMRKSDLIKAIEATRGNDDA